MPDTFIVPKQRIDCAVFVMPVFMDSGDQSVKWITQAVDSIMAQSDPNWKLVLVNDASPYKNTSSLLAEFASKDDRIHVIESAQNRGAGAARNMGIEWVHANGYPYIVYLDADDISHPDRVKHVRRIFQAKPDVGVVYSTFEVIDESGKKVPVERLSEPIKEILECHANPPQGDKAWIDIGTMTGYANLTSATAVRTEIAIEHLFPAENAAEDAHTWLRYGATGKHFLYDATIPTLYRIPQDKSESSMRDRLGGANEFYKQQCDIERDGFIKAVEIALAQGHIQAHEKERLLAGYHVRMAGSMRRFGQQHMARREIHRALSVSQPHAKEWIATHNYHWAQDAVEA